MLDWGGLVLILGRTSLLPIYLELGIYLEYRFSELYEDRGREDVLRSMSRHAFCILKLGLGLPPLFHFEG